MYKEVIQGMKELLLPGLKKTEMIGYKMTIECPLSKKRSLSNPYCLMTGYFNGGNDDDHKESNNQRQNKILQNINSAIAKSELTYVKSDQSIDIFTTMSFSKPDMEGNYGHNIVFKCPTALFSYSGRDRFLGFNG